MRLLSCQGSFDCVTYSLRECATPLQDDNQALQPQDDAGMVDMSGLNHHR
jgi:hypothetical protein